MTEDEENEELRQRIMELSPEEHAVWIETMKTSIKSTLPTLSIDQRRDHAQTWMDGIETMPALTVRCMDPGRSGTCNERMAMVWATPYGHIAHVRLPVSHARTMHGLQLAMRVRADEDDEALAQLCEQSIEVPHIAPMFLTEWDLPTGPGPDVPVPMGCKRRHGNVAVPAQTLITEADSPRRVLNLSPTKWREQNPWAQRQEYTAE